MRILVIGHESDLNGASRSLLNIVDELLRRGHSVYVLTSFSSGPFFDALLKRNVKILIEPFERWCIHKSSNVRSVKTIYIDSRLWIRVNRANSKIARKLAQFALNEGIDIIHSNTSVINIGALIRKYSGIGHVWHIREFGDLDFNIYPIIPKRFFFYFMNHYANKFICISQSVADHYYALQSNKKRVIYNGIDYSVQLERKNNRDTLNHVRILIAGRISNTKGQQEAIDACNLLVQKGITGFMLLIAGSIDESFQLVIPAHLSNNVIELGYIANMQDLRRTIDIELVCSKAEAFGRVTAEAMMLGIPVIGSNTGGTPELIQDGITGLLYEKGNVVQLAERIQYLIDHPKERNEMGHRAQDYARNHFTIERCVDEIEAVYREVLVQAPFTAKYEL